MGVVLDADSTSRSKDGVAVSVSHFVAIKSTNGCEFRNLSFDDNNDGRAGRQPGFSEIQAQGVRQYRSRLVLLQIVSK